MIVRIDSGCALLLYRAAGDFTILIVDVTPKCTRWFPWRSPQISPPVLQLIVDDWDKLVRDGKKVALDSRSCLFELLFAYG